MNTEDVPNRMPSMWEPMKKPLEVALIGKTNEEIGELIIELGMLLNIMNRCLIQGLEGRNPETSELNKTALENEIADVLAKLAQIVGDFRLDTEAIMKRVGVKHAFSGHWFDWLRANMKEPEAPEIAIELHVGQKYTLYASYGDQQKSPIRYQGEFLRLMDNSQNEIVLAFLCKLGDSDELTELAFNIKEIVPGSITEGWDTK